MKKIYTIIKTGRDDTKREIKGTLEELNAYFSSSSGNAKTIKSLLNRIQKAASEREACLYRRTFYELKVEEQPVFRVPMPKPRPRLSGWPEIRTLLFRVSVEELP